MARAFQFDVDRVAEQLDRILQMELAGVIYYTHYSFMIYGHARIPIYDLRSRPDSNHLLAAR